MCLAKNIRYLRKKNNLSQDDIADLLGYKSYTTIQKWEMGVSEPPIGKLRALASRLGVDIDVLATTDIEKAELQEHLASDPLRDYYDRLIRYLDSSPAHRQLISDAAHVRAEDIDLARQFLMRLADPGSSAPELPTLGTSANFQSLPSSNHGQDTDPREAPEKILRNAKNSCDCADTHVELTDEALALVRDTPEVLEAEAEYIKKMSVKPRRKGATASPSTGAEGRKSG